MYSNSPALLPYALLNAIGRDEALMDATEMFRVESRIGEIDAEDAAFWTVEQPLPDAVWDEAAVPLPAMLQTLALELGATLTPIAPREPLQAEGIAPPAPKPTAPIAPKTAPHSANAVREYLAAVCLLSNSKQVAALHAEILSLLATGTADDLAATLAEHRAVFPGFEAEVAARLVALHSAPQSEASTCPPEPLAEVTNTAPVALPSVKPPVPIAPTPMKVRPAAGRAAKTVSDIVQPLLFADLRESEAAHPAPHTDRVNDPFAAIDPREQWYQARAQLQLQLDRASFEHLRTMEFVRLEGQTYHFVEQRAHALKQLQGKLGREVQRVLRDVIGNNVDVMFEIPELPTEGVPKPDKVETSAARGAYYQRDVEQYGQPTKVNGMEIFVVPNDPNKTIVWQTVGGTQYRQSVDTGKVLYVVGFDHTETIAA